MVLHLLKTIWRGWKTVVHGLNAVISYTLMTVVYVTAVFPVAVGFRLFRPDPLDRGPGDPDATSEWKPIPGERHDVLRAQRPF